MELRCAAVLLEWSGLIGANCCLYRDICQWHRHIHAAAQVANDKVCSERSCLPFISVQKCASGLSHPGKAESKQAPSQISLPASRQKREKNGKRYVSWRYCVSLFIDALSSPFTHTRVISSPSPSALLRQKWLNFLFFNAGISDWIKICGAWGYGACWMTPHNGT